MFNLYRTITVLFVLAIFLNIQAVENVSSVNAYQEGKNIVITYQLSKRSNISVYVSTDGGKKFSSLKSISGDFGKNVSSGAKRIIWNVLADYEKFNFPEVCFKISANEYNGHEFVDLGLPSGTKWATCNVGATKPEEYGDYFAWGETESKDNYDSSTYKWTENFCIKYCIPSSYGNVDYKYTLELSDDAAHVNWGGDWRMPTSAEIRELCTECTWTRSIKNDVNGYFVTGPNGNSIFLPAAGYRVYSDLRDAGSFGKYWTSSVAYSYDFYAEGLLFSNYIDKFYDGMRSYGLSVRPVLQLDF